MTAPEPSSPAALDERPPERPSILTGVTLALLVLGCALAVALAWQWFEVYFTLTGIRAEATPAESARYAWTAGLSLVSLLAALVVAIARQRGGLIVVTSIAFVCALVGSLLFQVPQGRFAPTAPPVDDGVDRPVCYGTTGACPGG